MKPEEAIKNLKLMQAAIEWEYPMDYAATIDAAIEALEKQIPKAIFCDYCNPDSEGYVKPIEKNCHAFIRFGMNGWVLSLKGGGWHGECKIRFCPMCGRDLLVK